MNKQELINKLNKILTSTTSEIEGSDFDIAYNYAIKRAILLAEELDEQQAPINELEKPNVPQVAVEFYERYKDDNLALGEWFDDFYSPEAIEEFPRMDELTEWLYDNNDEINRQREFALATLVTLGIDAVVVEKEKLYTVELPNPNGDSNRYGLCKVDGRIIIGSFVFGLNKAINTKLTEAEIKQDFAWAWEFAEEVEE